MRHRTFEQSTAWLVSNLAIAGVQSGLLAGYLVALHLGWIPPGLSMRWAPAFGLAWQPVMLALVVLPAWSHRSHLLAVAHGWIPRRSAGWASWAWRIPGWNLWLPFTMLRERWLFYRCEGRSPVGRAQGSVLLALGALAVPPTVGTLLLSGALAIAACVALRSAVRTIAAAQKEAELHADAEQVFG